MKLAIWRQGSVYRAIALAIVAVATVAAASLALAQSSTYPDGSRSAAHWYFCYASRTNTTGSAPSGGWSATTCLKLLWAPGESYHMVASATSDGTNRYAEVVGWLIPARYVRTVSYHCLAAETATRFSGTGSAGSTVTADNSVNFTPGTSDWNNGVTVGVGNTAGVAATNSLDVVAHWDAMAADNWWTHDVVAGWTSSGGTDGTGWRVVSNQSSVNFTATGEFECWVIDYSMDDGHSRWEPGEDDLPPATPTPTATPDGLGWDTTPWEPISDTEKMPTFDIGEPGEEVCYTVIPGYTFTYDSVEYGWDYIEFCTREYEINIGLFGINLGAYLVTFFLLGGVGILWAILRTP